MKLLKYILIVFTSFTLSSTESKAQIDTTFWFAAPWVTPDHWWRDPIAFEFSTFNYPTTTIRIQQPSSTYDTTFNVGPNTLFTKYMHHMMDSLENKPANTLLHHGFKISASNPITIVYDIITRTPNFYNPETYSLKGQNGMGTEFVLPFQTLWDNQTLGGDLNGDAIVSQPYQQGIIVATEDNTTIYITPRCPVVGHPANITYSVFLPYKGMTYTIQNATQNTNVVGNNMAGTIVVADKPVSVTVTDDSVNPAGGGGCYDLMGDQLVPTDVIGNEYIINRGFLNAGSNESIFVVATQNFTTVTIDNGVTTTTALLNQGDTYPYSITQPLTYVNSDKAVYLLHMSGYGCELGEAILPPLNCAGSDTIAFARANGQSFLLNILCKAGSQGSFLLNGSAVPITAGMFSPVPGTGGAWMGAQISFTTAVIPVGSSNLITNSTDLFGMGVINGGATTGCLYHYLSSFIRRVYTDAGNDTILCNGSSTINLNGSVTGGATTGIWTCINGTGTVNTPTNLSTTYNPTASDFAQGTLTFVLSSTGNCNPVTDTMKVDFIQSPLIDAGVNNSFCTNNVGAIPVNGSVLFAAGASWSGGSGGAFANSGDLTTTYTPSPADLAADSLVLYLTSAGSFFACPNDQDTLVIYFTDPPVVFAGADQVICSNSPLVPLNGSVTGASTTGQWSTTGAGAFSPSDLLLTTDYLISSTDTAVGSIYITLTSTANGNCNAVQDSLEVIIVNKPVVSILNNDSVCANLPNFNLNGTVTFGYTTLWSSSGLGTIVAPANLNTIYNISPFDTAAGFINIILSTNGGICPAVNDTLTVYFIDQAKAIAGPDQAFCANEVIQLNGVVTGGIATGYWASTGTGTFSPGTNFLVTTYAPSALDIAAGTIELILTTSSNFGCNPDVDTLVVTFLEPPVANFSNTTACAGDNTNFTDLSTTGPGTISNWNWNFGDFTTSIAQDPIHNYTSSGTFTVTLIAGSSNGCFDTIQYAIEVYPLPIADFVTTTGCEGTPLQFLDNSFIPAGTSSITAWDYTWGDGTPNSSLEDPIHTFAAVGTYSVNLLVTTNFGCSDTVIHNINVFARPTAIFSATPNPAEALENITFTDLSTTQPMTAWEWLFGDSTGANTQTPIHNYANGGIYTVTFIVTDANGCIDTTRGEIVVALLPVLPTAFTPNGDNENDYFLIRGGPFSAMDFRIYNNWGELIFSTTDILTIGWDGTYKGEIQPMTVYTWTYEVQIANGKIYRQSGDVTLLR